MQSPQAVAVFLALETYGRIHGVMKQHGRRANDVRGFHSCVKRRSSYTYPKPTSQLRVKECVQMSCVSTDASQCHNHNRDLVQLLHLSPSSHHLSFFISLPTRLMCVCSSSSEICFQCRSDVYCTMQQRHPVSASLPLRSRADAAFPPFACSSSSTSSAGLTLM